MKTAISLPDTLFERAELMAQHMGLNRSQLYTQALSEFLAKHDHAAITAAFDAVYADTPVSLDTELVTMQAASMDTDEW
jgi:metal-responsive CopG/Arc/MetJ family transcriptional regulator